MSRQLTAAEELYFDAEAHADDADAAAEDAADSGALIEQYYQMSIAAAMRDICRDLLNPRNP